MLTQRVRPRFYAGWRAFNFVMFTFACHANRDRPNIHSCKTPAINILIIIFLIQSAAIRANRLATKIDVDASTLTI